MTQIKRNFFREYGGMMASAFVFALGLVIWIFQNPTDVTWIFSGIGLFLILLFPMILFGIKKVQRNMMGDPKKLERLLASGIKASATILHMQETGVVFNHVRPVVRMTVRVSPPNGQPPFEAQIETVVSLLQVPKIGEAISVVYDGNNVTDMMMVPS